LVVTLVFSAGCATKKIQEETTLTPPPPQTLSPPVDIPPAVAAVDQDVAAETVAEEPQVVVAPLPTSVLQIVPFEYDQHLLSDSAREILAANTAILMAQDRLQVTLAGYCDERGSDQYNIALGERRAEAVRNYLLSLGISAGRLEVVSYGEEKPLDAGHDEDAWAKNRRVEFVPML
jgi:peptidoglycan-associated lipoprotein